MSTWLRRWRRRAGGVLLLVAMAVLLGLFPTAEQIVSADGQRVHVIDGDSLRIGGRVVRLADMDAVELRQLCRASDGAQWSCGLDARTALEELVRLGGLSCRSRTTDAYDRAVARCAVNSVSDVGAALVAQGWAVSGDARRQGAYAEQEQHARAAKLGIWRGTFDPPAQWRADHPRDDEP